MAQLLVVIKVAGADLEGCVFVRGERSPGPGPGCRLSFVCREEAGGRLSGVARAAAEVVAEGVLHSLDERAGERGDDLIRVQWLKQVIQLGTPSGSAVRAKVQPFTGEAAARRRWQELV